MNPKTILISLLIFIGLATPASAKLNVVATLPWIGSLVQEIGKDKVNLKVLVKPNRDPHYVEAKPSMILAARNADVLMYNGLDLEIGYLPLLIESSRNAKIQPGRPGNFDCSRFIDVLDRQFAADRSMGDVHPLGNPHYHFSAPNVLKAVRGMARRLAELDPANGAAFRANLASFEERFKSREKQWKAAPLKGKRFIAYHRSFEYTARDFEFRIIGYIEPRPGIPPSAAHLDSLIGKMKETKPDGILIGSAFGGREALSLSQRTGVRLIVLPQDVGALPGTGDWFGFMDAVVSALNSAMSERTMLKISSLRIADPELAPESFK